MGGAKREWEKMLESDPDYPSPDQDWWQQQEQDLEKEDQESHE